MTMKAQHIDAYLNKETFSKSQVKIIQVPKPSVKPNELLVRVGASSINPVDNAILFGVLAQSPIFADKLPIIPGYDLAGVVVEIGSEVTRFKVGDSVYGSALLTKLGSYAEFTSIPEAEVALKPKSLTYVEAATFPIVGLTSYQALIEAGKLTKGERVLILGGAGGTGTLGIQIAKIKGAKVTTTTSEKNIEFVRSLGADRVIDYNKQKWWELKGEEDNYDLIYDTVGAQESFDEAVKFFARINKKGRYVTIVPGVSNAAAPDGPEFNLFFCNTQRPDNLDFIRESVEAGTIRPTVEKVFDIDQIGDAYISQKEGRTRGKTAIRIAQWADQKDVDASSL